ncbi:MAG: hypothetical protein ACE5FW_02085 [Candidatus Aenigmatarchaeota archaeon]
MGKVVIVDNCLAPDKDIFLSYSGPDPWKIVRGIEGAIRPFFHVSSVGTSNTRLNWDRSGDPVEFFSTWWVKKPFSGYTGARWDIKAQGNQGKTSGIGRFSIRITANLTTEFAGWSPFVKPVWYMYSYLFYDKVRRRMIERCREFSEGFRNVLKEQFGLEATSYGPITSSME